MKAISVLFNADNAGFPIAERVIALPTSEKVDPLNLYVRIFFERLSARTISVPLNVDMATSELYASETSKDDPSVDHIDPLNLYAFNK
jgi:hypothetical protein